MKHQQPPLSRLGRRLGRRFFERDPRLVAAELIGHGIVRRIEDVWVGGRVVETEAYLSQDDPASHSRSGPTRRCQSMFADAGTLYVYSIHARYCMNVVTQKPGIGSAVLIRAIEPLWGLQIMQSNRGYDDLRKLTRGPAMLCQSLAIDAKLDGLDLATSAEIFFIRLAAVDRDVISGPRIGISGGQELSLRFFELGSRFVSGSLAKNK